MSGRLNRGFAYREQISARAEGRGVLDWLAARHRHSARETWAARLEAGEVTLDGAVARGPERLAAGQWLVWQRPPWIEPDVPLCCAVLYRDPHLLAVAKPRGLPTMPAGGFLEHTLLALVRRLEPEATPVHRLGRHTSGLVLCALTAEARAALAAAWRTGAVEKVYRALVTGEPAADAFTVDVPIGPVPHARLGTVEAASAQGRPARSQVRVLERRGEASLVEVAIETGRPHQIRIHLAAAGHPLVGDPLYLRGGLPRDEALPGDGGYHLHAWHLALAHPATGQRLLLECPPPPVLIESRA